MREASPTLSGSRRQVNVSEAEKGDLVVIAEYGRLIETKRSPPATSNASPCLSR
jgi:hypothetical protein